MKDPVFAFFRKFIKTNVQNFGKHASKKSYVGAYGKKVKYIVKKASTYRPYNRHRFLFYKVFICKARNEKFALFLFLSVRGVCKECNQCLV